MSKLSYVVLDRSLLLPAYKRFCVEPLLPFIPRRLHPNVITHVGHLVNALGAVLLFALAPRSGAAFVASAACLQIYNFCDNADGGHARRTQQCSALGELLDHGLDILNTTYIACVAAIAVGASPMWWAAIAIVVPAACAATYWEQAETGVFRLGMLNQIESVMMLTAILVVSTVFGVDVWQNVHVGPISARLAMTTFVCGTATFGIVRNVVRIARAKGIAALVHGLPHLSFLAAALMAASNGTLSTTTAAIAGTAATVFFGVRSLALRTRNEEPHFEAGLVLGTALLSALIVLGRGGIDLAVAVSSIAFFGTYAVANARLAYRSVMKLDRA